VGEGGGKEPEADALILSNAGATGLSLRAPGPKESAVSPRIFHHQGHQGHKGRNWGSSISFPLVPLVVSFSTAVGKQHRIRAARPRALTRKYDLRKTFVDAGESMDDTGLAAYIARARAEKSAVADSKEAQLAA